MTNIAPKASQIVPTIAAHLTVPTVLATLVRDSLPVTDPSALKIVARPMDAKVVAPQETAQTNQNAMLKLVMKPMAGWIVRLM